MSTPDNLRDIYEEYDIPETTFLDKMKNNPSVCIGLVGLTSVVAYNIYKFKSRGNISTSMYLIHLRLTAQGLFLGCMTMGLAYTMFQNFMKQEIKKPKD